MSERLRLTNVTKDTNTKDFSIKYYPYINKSTIYKRTLHHTRPKQRTRVYPLLEKITFVDKYRKLYPFIMNLQSVSPSKLEYSNKPKLKHPVKQSLNLNKEYTQLFEH